MAHSPPAIFAAMKPDSSALRLNPLRQGWAFLGGLALLFAGCLDGSSGEAMPTGGAENGVQDSTVFWPGRPSLDDDPFVDPVHPEYMAGPTVVHYPEEVNIHLTPVEFSAFKGQLQSFLETNNDGQYREHFQNHYISETFPTDSVFELYVRMWGQWDSIGVRNRFDHWAVRYISPFEEGDVYDVALAEVDIRHHMVFEKRWTGNYRNFGRTLSERYPGAEVTYMDTTWVNDKGDTLLRRHITAEAARFLYAVRGHDENGRSSRICWMNDGWQLVPEVVSLMDSASVAAVEAHQSKFGTLESRPRVSGR